MKAALPLLLAAGPAMAGHDWQDRDPARGGALYAEHCAACHGGALEGQPDWQVPGPDGLLPAPPHDGSGHTWHHPTPMLLAYIRDGGAETLARMGVTGVPSAMPGFGDILSEPEILDILAHIRRSWPEPLRGHQDSISHAE